MVGLNRGKNNIATNEIYEIEVVDGQQRLTTLIILYKCLSLLRSLVLRSLGSIQSMHAFLGGDTLPLFGVIFVVGGRGIVHIYFRLPTTVPARRTFSPIPL
jgi:hypothetical protein